MSTKLALKLYKARLKTSGKTSKQIEASFDGSKPSEEEIQNWIKAYDLIDGIEVVVWDLKFKDSFTLVGWLDEDDWKIRDFIYQAEQDEYFGIYINDREQFIKDWESENYSPDGSLRFAREDVEIIEELKRK